MATSLGTPAATLGCLALLACGSASGTAPPDGGDGGRDEAVAPEDVPAADADQAETQGDADVDVDVDVDVDADVDVDVDVDVDASDAGGLPWVVVAPGGRCFATEDGEPFVPLGNQPGTGFLDQPDEIIDAHFARMEDCGETVVRLDFDYFFRDPDPRYVGLESDFGVFDPARAARIDAVFRLAAAHGIRILPVPWITSPPMWESWPLNLYGDVDGRPPADPRDDPYHDFLTNNDARDRYGRRLELISGRWASTGAFFGWDLMNEADVLLNWNSIEDPGSLETWVEQIGSRVRDFEETSFGRAHPRMVSWSVLIPGPPEGSTLPPEDYHFLFRSPALDMASTHPYDVFGTNITRWPALRTSIVQPAIDAHDRIRTILTSRIADRRPFMENERNPNTGTMLRFHREADHAMAWAEIASGAAGAGITWLEGVRPHVLQERHENLGPSRRALRAFVDRIPDEYFLSETTDEGLDPLDTASRGVAVMSTRRGGHAVGWIAGTDDTCVLAQCVNDERAAVAAACRDDEQIQERLLALVLWVQILQDADPPVTVDPAEFAGLQAALSARPVDADAVWAEVCGDGDDPGVFAYLEGIGAATLEASDECPLLEPDVSFGMPAGDYLVEWFDDDAGTPIGDPVPVAAGGVLRTPSFERHVAVSVRPR
jgi:hypothetical protein